MIKTSETLSKLATALNAAQKEIKGAVKDSANPFFKSRYADLESVIEALQPIYAHGLSFVQMSSHTPEGMPVIVTRIMHNSGEWIEGDFPIVVKEQNNPQALGSSVTYSRRYSLAAAFGVPAVDDDAEHAMGRPQTTPVPVKTPVPIQGATKTVSEAKAAVERLRSATTRPSFIDENELKHSGPVIPVSKSGKVDPKSVPASAHDHKWMKSRYPNGDDWCGVKGCSARRPADNIL